MESFSDKVLFVDDEPNLLDGIRRQLYKKFALATAISGEEALNLIEKEGPYAVVVSDMRMPGMDGIQFLGNVRKHFPESIRVMLTGNADLDTAIAAVNEGNIFRFITKPCPPETLEKVLKVSFRQYHLVKAEHELLENTLKGAIKVLVDILAITNPVAFSRAARIKYFVGQMAFRLQLQDLWRYEIAAMLSQIGCVTIPSDVLEKFYSNQKLSSDERKMVEDYPIIGYTLIANIPRLESVANIILHQQQDFAKQSSSQEVTEKNGVTIGAEILRVAIDFDTELSRGLSKERAIKVLQEHENLYYNPSVLATLRDIDIPVFEKKVTTVNIKEFRKGMVLEEDVLTKKGLLLVTKGQEVTTTVSTLLENHFKRGDIKDHVLVSIPINVATEDT
jgi:response regulator RpfG family c-di-GMP phosphodiesterase